MYRNLLSKSNSDEFQKALLFEIQQLERAAKVGAATAMRGLQIEEEKGAHPRIEEASSSIDDPMGCNLGTHISTQRSPPAECEDPAALGRPSHLQNDEKGSASAPGFAIPVQGPNKLPSELLVSQAGSRPLNNLFAKHQATPADRRAEQVALLNGDGSPQVLEGLERSVRSEAASQSQNSSQVSGSERGSTGSSLSIYDRYPNLPRQLREIVEYQTFRIANMQAEVKSLKASNERYEVAFATQGALNSQVDELRRENGQLREMLRLQQSQHMFEIDQICGQIGPMMEALKILTSDLTVDLNQTELHLASSKFEDDEAGECSYLPKNQGGLMNKSLLSLTRSPALLSRSLSLNNSKFRLRALQSARSNLLAKEQVVGSIEGQRQASLKQLVDVRNANHQPHQNQQFAARGSQIGGNDLDDDQDGLQQPPLILTSERKRANEIGAKQRSHRFAGTLADSDKQFDHVDSDSCEKTPAPISIFTGPHGGPVNGAYLHGDEDRRAGDDSPSDGEIGNDFYCDEADIPASARAVSSTLQTPVFKKKSKLQIDFGLQLLAHQRNHSWDKPSIKPQASLSVLNEPSERARRRASGKNRPLAGRGIVRNPFMGAQAESLSLLSDLHGSQSPHETGVTAANVQMNDVKILERATTTRPFRRSHNDASKQSIYSKVSQAMGQRGARADQIKPVGRNAAEALDPAGLAHRWPQRNALWSSRDSIQHLQPTPSFKREQNKQSKIIGTLSDCEDLEHRPDMHDA